MLFAIVDRLSNVIHTGVTSKVGSAGDAEDGEEGNAGEAVIGEEEDGEEDNTNCFHVSFHFSLSL